MKAGEELYFTFKFFLAHHGWSSFQHLDIEITYIYQIHKEIISTIHTWKPLVLVKSCIFMTIGLYSTLASISISISIIRTLLQVFGMELHMSYYSAIAPPLIYSIICCVTDMKAQVRIAQLLSIFYACVMGSYLIWNLFIAVEYNKLSALGLLMFCKSLSCNPIRSSRKKFSLEIDPP